MVRGRDRGGHRTDVLQCHLFLQWWWVRLGSGCEGDLWRGNPPGRWTMINLNHGNTQVKALQGGAHCVDEGADAGTKWREGRSGVK